MCILLLPKSALAGTKTEQLKYDIYEQWELYFNSHITIVFRGEGVSDLSKTETRP